MHTFPFSLYALTPGIEGTSSPEAYRRYVLEIAELTEHYGYTGALIHYNHQTLSPWVLATLILAHTSNHVPLIAVQPNTMPPYTVAKMIASLASLYGRRVALNLIAGASQAELIQTDDLIDHDQRYARLQEYGELILALCRTDIPLSYQGQFYTLQKLLLQPVVPEHLLPEIFIAGSSSAGQEAAFQIADVLVTHPQPITSFVLPVEGSQRRVRMGIRLGIIARAEKQEAWECARARFPVSREGRIRTQMQKRSQSQWIRDLTALAEERDVFDEVYWLGAYQSGKANCPYLVGTYHEVAAYLQRYLTLGIQELLIDGASTQEDFAHIDAVFANVLNCL